MSTITAIKSSVDSILEFVYPSCCLNCGSYIEQSGELICPDCWDKIRTFDHLFCGNCENPLDSNKLCENCGRDKTMPIIALGHYTDPLSEIIRYFKYRDFQKLGPILAEKLTAKYSTLFGKAKIDIIIPVPLHSYRLKTRGYNQAEILVRELSNHFKIPFQNDIIYDINIKPSQITLSKNKRQTNVEGVFFVKKDLEGNRIILVDDIFTTGSTVKACCESMQQKNAEKLLVITLSKTI